MIYILVDLIPLLNNKVFQSHDFQFKHLNLLNLETCTCIQEDGGIYKLNLKRLFLNIRKTSDKMRKTPHLIEKIQSKPIEKSLLRAYFSRWQLNFISRGMLCGGKKKERGWDFSDGRSFYTHAYNSGTLILSSNICIFQAIFLHIKSTFIFSIQSKTNHSCLKNENSWCEFLFILSRVWCQ